MSTYWAFLRTVARWALEAALWTAYWFAWLAVFAVAGYFA